MNFNIFGKITDRINFYFGGKKKTVDSAAVVITGDENEVKACSFSGYKSAIRIEGKKNVAADNDIVR